jgi:osomolarity two-component system sensor histidine kinase SLN1
VPPPRYVFHEVRVPLNTALLAVQNMEASGVVPRAQEIEFKALAGSLSMMSKVLNDVLDLCVLFLRSLAGPGNPPARRRKLTPRRSNRMDSGRFESVNRPYSFHQVMRSLFVPLRLAADARNLNFVTDLDLRIDRVRAVAYSHLLHAHTRMRMYACAHIPYAHTPVLACNLRAYIPPRAHTR